MNEKVKAKGRKIGRNKKWCEGYKMAGTRMRNKIKKIRKHVKKFPDDKRAVSALTRLT